MAAGKTFRILIVGGNFAGIAAARAIPASFDVTVVDRSDRFEWVPNIHELVSRHRTPASLRGDRRRMVAMAGHRFVRGEIRDLDPTRGTAVTETGRKLGFDACIVAAGGVHDDYGVPGAARHAMAFKSVGDCARIGAKLVELARRARYEVGAAPAAHGKRTGRKPEPRRGADAKALFTVVIVGGGIEGIECLGEVLRSYRQHPALQVHVVEAAGRLLAGAPRAVDRAVRAHCADLPVHFHMHTRVTAVTSRGVRLDGDGRPGASLRAGLVIWNGGSRPAPLLQRAGLAGDAREWAPVAATLQSKPFANVFVAGDAAALPRPISKQAFFALQMGAHAGANVVRLLSGQRLLRFHPAPKPMLLAFGDFDTFLVGDNTVLAGTALALVKEGVLQATLATLDPPTSGGGALAMGWRVLEGLRVAALPELLSLERLLRLPGIRLLR